MTGRRKYFGCLRCAEPGFTKYGVELRIIANVKNDRMAMSKIKMFRISDELSSHMYTVLSLRSLDLWSSADWFTPAHCWGHFLPFAGSL